MMLYPLYKGGNTMIMVFILFTTSLQSWSFIGLLLGAAN